MTVALIVLNILAGLFLVGVVLLQSGKGADMGAAFGGAGNTVFGPAGPGNVLTKATAATAAVFMGTSLALAVVSADEESVIDGMAEPTPVSQPAAPVAIPTPPGAAGDGSADASATADVEGDAGGQAAGDSLAIDSGAETETAEKADEAREALGKAVEEGKISAEEATKAEGVYVPVPGKEVKHPAEEAASNAAEAAEMQKVVEEDANKAAADVQGKAGGAAAATSLAIDSEAETETAIKAEKAREALEKAVEEGKISSEEAAKALGTAPPAE